ncbi:MAG: hypothetical protein MJY92_02570 [Bacteroidales bacterium]|nr:hypothetical protein [Bacteroidales bacterium]
MRKLFVYTFAAAMLSMLFASCSPLHVAMNSTDKKGVRTVCTSDIDLFGSFEIALGYKAEKTDTLMGILITCLKNSDHGVFQKDDLLRLRLTDGSEIELANLYEREFDKDVSTEYRDDIYYQNRIAYAYSPYYDAVYLTPVTVRTWVPRVYTRTTTKSFALYFVTKQQLMDIMQKGVVKCRVEIEDEDCDMPYPERFAARISELYAFLMQVKPVERKRF